MQLKTDFTYFPYWINQCGLFSRCTFEDHIPKYLNNKVANYSQPDVMIVGTSLYNHTAYVNIIILLPLGYKEVP